ncbi:MAG TPA: PAS domain S-box protein, partial [candidate division Zixibacteria bacterium]|nr:PAS domain S-box protein [candidate division Zixibacteria bacterium]
MTMIYGVILAFGVVALAAAAVFGFTYFRTLARERNAFAAREAELHVILDATVDAIIVIDERSVIRVFNNAAQRIFGYTEAEALGQNVSTLIAEPDRSQHDRHVENYLLTRSPKVLDRRREVIAQRKNGERFPVELSVQEARIAGRRAFVGVLQDITEKKRIDDELRYSRERYIRELEHRQIVLRTLAERLDADTGERFFESLVRHLARTFSTRYALVAKTHGDGAAQATTISVCDGDSLMENFQYDVCGTPCELVINRGELCAFPKDLPRLFPNDPLITQMKADSYVGAPLVGPDGRVCGLIAILDTEEMTEIESAASALSVFATRAATELERLTAAAALKASEERYRAVFDAASDGIVVISSTIRIKTVNPAVCRMYGGSCQEFLGRRPSKFIHPNHLKEFNNFLRRLRA